MGTWGDFFVGGTKGVGCFLWKYFLVCHLKIAHPQTGHWKTPWLLNVTKISKT